MTRSARRSRAGFTLLESLIALTVVGLILGNVVMVVGTSSEAYDRESNQAGLELQIDQTLDRIVLALMGASAESLVPGNPSPVFHTSLEFQQSLGVQGGVLQTSNPERIELVVDQGEVVWRDKPGELDERSVVWSRWVAAFLENEIPNGIDDNGNGLIDESGLSFEIDGSMVTIRLTLQRIGSDGKTSTYSREAIVHCRNS